VSDSNIPDTDPSPSSLPSPASPSVTQPETPSARVDVIADLSSAETHAQIVSMNEALDQLREAAKVAGIDPRIVEVIKAIHVARKQIDAVRPILTKLEMILPAAAVIAIEVSIRGIDEADDEVRRLSF